MGVGDDGERYDEGEPQGCAIEPRRFLNADELGLKGIGVIRTYNLAG